MISLVCLLLAGIVSIGAACYGAWLIFVAHVRRTVPGISDADLSHIARAFWTPWKDES